VIQEVLLAQAIVLHVNSDETRLDRTVVLDLCETKDVNNPFLTPDLVEGSGWHLLQAAFEENKSRSMIDCLRLSINASSSDPRDKIFGVHSLLQPRTKRFLPVDYSLDYEQVFGIALMLCIAEMGRLNLLMYARLPDTSDIYSACTFGREEFREYLLHGDYLAPEENSSTFRFTECNRPWRPCVSVKMISSTTQRLDTVIPTREGLVSVVQQTSTRFPFQQILPRLEVRAHLLDISCETIGRKEGVSPDSTTDILRDIMLHMSLADRDVSSSAIGSSEWLWLGNIFRLPRDQKLREETDQRTSRPTVSIFNRSDFTQFQMEVNSFPISTILRTYYSVGFSTSNHIAGDHIFAIDGASRPMMLRQVGPDTFRIVGHCYLWAARDLNYWSPGTHKGLWLERPFDLGESTRMIEIY
jgi:hypothetical protein